jgi:hypothetical protein
MAGRLGRYVFAALIPAAVGVAGLGPFQCSIYGSCTGGYNWTPQMMLLGATVGAVIGVVGMALIDLIYNGRYLLANRTEAKAKRMREEAQRRSQQAPPDRRA